jgi:hypothetical protein
MKKSQILKLVPQAKELKKSLKAAEKALVKAEKELSAIEQQVDAIEGVTVENGFPFQIACLESGNVEVFSACDEVSRFATVTGDLDGTASVFGYFDVGQQTDLGTFGRKDALALAKHFVATGKSSLPKPKAAKDQDGEPAAPKKRGRPRKNVAA